MLFPLLAPVTAVQADKSVGKSRGDRLQFVLFGAGQVRLLLLPNTVIETRIVRPLKT
jgi:hypothetical protein